MKPAGKGTDQDKLADGEVVVVQTNRPVAGVIEGIHSITDQLVAIRNYLRARLARAQLWSQAHPIAEVMLVLAPMKWDREDSLLYELSFTEKTLEGVNVSHDDAIVLVVNICNYDVKRVLIDPESSSEVMYHNAYNQLC